VVPAILLILTLLIILIVCLLKLCSRRERTRDRAPQYLHQNHRHTTHRQSNTHRRNLKGIDGIFNPFPYPVKCFSTENANNSEKQDFLGFASFLSNMGPHPFIPALLGVVSVQAPFALVVEELKHRDLLGFLWRCRQVPADNSGCEMTEKRIFTMAGQVASALEYLHSRQCIHGNVGACSVLVGADMTAKLWGLGPAYRRTHTASTMEVEEVGMKKWQAPEVLARRGLSQSSDIWSFGIFLYEMVTLGGPPFAQVPVTELLQYLQSGKYLRQPSTCSSSLYSIMKSCGHYSPQRRLSISQLINVLHTGETSADGRRPLRVTEPLNFDRYMREAGLREAADSAFL
uniref:Protein kinase domain-containing protein n=1 Tax=Oryzias latipes TaxID=8090 RepID=A0A3P9KAI4_ORYLA